MRYDADTPWYDRDVGTLASDLVAPGRAIPGAIADAAKERLRALMNRGQAYAYSGRDVPAIEQTMPAPSAPPAGAPSDIESMFDMTAPPRAIETPLAQPAPAPSRAIERPLAPTAPAPAAAIEANAPTSAPPAKARPVLRYSLGKNEPLHDYVPGEGPDIGKPGRDNLSILGPSNGGGFVPDSAVDDAVRRRFVEDQSPLAGEDAQRYPHLRGSDMRDIEKAQALNAYDPRASIARRQEAERGADAQRLQQLRDTLRQRGATPDETDAAIKKFVKDSALRQALRDGNYGPLAQLLKDDPMDFSATPAAPTAAPKGS